MTYYPAYPGGMRFKAEAEGTWYPPYNMIGALAIEHGDDLVVFDDDDDMDYEDPNGDGWALVRKKETNEIGYVPEAFLDIKKAIPPSKWKKPNPGKPDKPMKKTSNHPDGKPAKMEKINKQAEPACPLPFCGKKASKGKMGKKRAIELAEEGGDDDDDDSDDEPP